MSYLFVKIYVPLDIIYHIFFNFQMGLKILRFGQSSIIYINIQNVIVKFLTSN